MDEEALPETHRATIAAIRAVLLDPDAAIASTCTEPELSVEQVAEQECLAVYDTLASMLRRVELAAMPTCDHVQCIDAAHPLDHAWVRRLFDGALDARCAACFSMREWATHGSWTALNEAGWKSWAPLEGACPV
jgi:hypothetical protein